MFLNNNNKCPYLLLAPMEGVGDYCFRKAMASIGGFDEAVRDFIRVPHNAHIKSLARVYDADELAPIPLAAQIMGSEPGPMAEMAQELMARGALRIDVNCGCPSNTVTGRGAGSSLLKDPDFLLEVTRAVVKAVPIPVTIKMRSGFADSSLFNENILAAQESGAAYITLHPRTKAEGYVPPAHWDLIARAKSLLTIPLVGNGDILSVNDAVAMLRTTGCDALMIGRGSIINPFIFHQIRAHFNDSVYEPRWEALQAFLDVFLTATIVNYPSHLRVNRLKQLFSYLFKARPALLEKRPQILRASFTDPHDFLQFATPILARSYDVLA
jgi:tRNA-dihydrouridine synthase C